MFVSGSCKSFDPFRGGSQSASQMLGWVFIIMTFLSHLSIHYVVVAKHKFDEIARLHVHKIAYAKPTTLASAPGDDP